MPDQAIVEALDSKKQLDRWTRFWTKVVVAYVILVTTVLAAVTVVALVNGQNTLDIIKQVTSANASRAASKATHDEIVCLNNHVDVVVKGLPELPQCHVFDR